MNRMSIAARLLRLAIRAYQLILSPLLGQNCRYLPTCSAYAAEAIATHGAARGAVLAAKRICKCHPFGGHGYDPVPPKLPHSGASRRAGGHGYDPAPPISQ